MKVSIVCAADRMERLPCLFWSLIAQTYTDWEFIILDQSVDKRLAVDAMITTIPDNTTEKIRYASRPYHGDWGQTIKAEAARTLAKGELLMFPNDDAYYVPTALEELVGVIECGNDIAICGWLYDQLDYAAMRPSVREGYIDVGGFMIKRDLFLEVGWRNQSQVGDAALIADCIKAGGKLGMHNGVLYVKN